MALSFLPGFAACDSRQSFDKERFQSMSQEIVRMFLEKSKINSYFHEKSLPERSPLIIIKNEVCDGSASLDKFGKPVVFMTKAVALERKLPYLEIESLDVKAGKAFLKYSYPVEGLAGDARFSWVDGQWLLTEEQTREN